MGYFRVRVRVSVIPLESLILTLTLKRFDETTILLTGESNKKKRTVENEIMNTTSIQVNDLSHFYHSTSIFFYRLNLTKQQVIVSEILIVSDKNFLNDGKILSNQCKIRKVNLCGEFYFKKKIRHEH